MATLYEYYNTNNDQSGDIYGVLWKAQTFTPATAHTITSVKLKLYRVGSPGTITVGIRATSSGKPTGNDLCSGTYDGNSITTNIAGAWYEITFGAGYNLSAGTVYAIVVRATSANGSTSYVEWRMDGSSSTYSGGQYYSSGDSGSTWDGTSSYDFMFEDWGNPSTITLVIAEMLHSQTMDGLTLTQLHNIVIQELLHSQTIDNLILTQLHNLIINELLHSQTIDNLVLIENKLLAIQELLHSQNIDNLDIVITGWLLIIQDLLHSQTINGLSLLAGTKYAIVVRALNGDVDNRVYWRIDTTGTYDNGNFLNSTNYGVSWTGYDLYDLMFKEYEGLTLYENLDTGDTTGSTFYGTNWRAQTFTPSIAHELTSVKLKLYKEGNPGIVTVSIRATSAGKPTGSDLCLGTIDGDSLTTDTGGDWY